MLHADLSLYLVASYPLIAALIIFAGFVLETNSDMIIVLFGLMVLGVLLTLAEARTLGIPISGALWPFTVYGLVIVIKYVQTHARGWIVMFRTWFGKIRRHT
jgi:hypothetical protein